MPSRWGAPTLEEEQPTTIASTGGSAWRQADVNQLKGTEAKYVEDKP